MANEVLQKVGTQIVFADHAGDFSPTDANDLRQGTPVNVQLITASLADVAARESAKVDLGATRARQYSVIAALELAATPTTGEVMEFYWCASPDAIAANGNPGYCSGSDAAFTGTPATLVEAVKQLIFIGTLICSADAIVQIQNVSVFSPPERHGILVIKNEAGAAFHADDVETHIVMNPIVDEVQ